LRIVKQISPEVVFCEAPPEIFPDMVAAEKNFNTPEIKVIRELLKESNIKIIPVDIYDKASNDERIDEMFDLFGQKMENYKNALKYQSEETYLKGYNFLNSKASDKINFDKLLMEREIVTNENSKELATYYLNWLKWNEYRE
jgi:arsenate reductase-like glutaredoxin family protein